MIGLGWQVLFRTKNQVKISYTDTQCAECFQGLKHVACLCKRVILCQSSSSQLYLPSRVQSPGSFEQKKPYNSAFCLVIMQLDSTSSRLIHVAENAATKQSTICINLPHPPTSDDRIGVTSHISYQKTKSKSHTLTQSDTQCAECFQGLKHVACLCKRVILCQSSSSQLYLPSRVQSPGSFEQKKPYNSAFCLVIMQLDSTSSRLIHVAENAATKQSTICINLPHPPTSDDRIGVTSHISYQKTKSKSHTLTHNVRSAFRSQTCCMPMQACHSLPVIQFSALFTLPSSVTRLFWAKKPYNSAFCLVIMQLDSTSSRLIHVASICHIHPHPMIGLGWQVIFRTKNQVKISCTDTQCAECFQVSNMLHAYASVSFFASHPVLSFIYPPEFSHQALLSKKAL